MKLISLKKEIVSVVVMTKPKCLACDEVKCKGNDMKYRGFGQTTCQCRCHEIIKCYEMEWEGFEV